MFAYGNKVRFHNSHKGVGETFLGEEEADAGTLPSWCILVKVRLDRLKNRFRLWHGGVESSSHTISPRLCFILAKGKKKLLNIEGLNYHM